MFGGLVFASLYLIDVSKVYAFHLITLKVNTMTDLSHFYFCPEITKEFLFHLICLQFPLKMGLTLAMLEAGTFPFHQENQ